MLIILSSDFARAAQPLLGVPAECRRQAEIPLSISNPIISYGHASYKDFYKQFACGDLFSSDPPDGLKAQLERQGAEWFPFCSYYSMNRISALRNQFSMTPINVTEAYRSFANRDACTATLAMGELLPSQSPSLGRSIKLASARENGGVRLASDRQKKERATRFKGIRDRIADQCCADGLPGCRESMSRVGLRWCTPDDDVKNNESCSKMTTYFQLAPEEWNRLHQFVYSFQNKKFWFASSKKNYLKSFPVSPGRVTISPYMIDGRFTDNDHSIFHELGHACSWNRRQLLAQQGSEDSLSMFTDVYDVFDHRDRPSRGCAISEATEKVYREIFAKVGASSYTTNCLLKMSRNAPNRRFEKGTCWRGCSRRFMEESFADWMALNSMQSAEILGNGLHASCIGTRDDEHPLAADSFACFIATPSLYHRVSEAAGCR